MRWTPRATLVPCVVLAFVAALGPDARADVPGDYVIHGQGPDGRYKGHASIEALGGDRHHVRVRHDGAEASVEAEAHLAGVTLAFVVASESPGLVGALRGTAGAPRVLVALVVAADGTLRGTWREDGALTLLRLEVWTPAARIAAQVAARDVLVDPLVDHPGAQSPPSGAMRGGHLSSPSGAARFVPVAEVIDRAGSAGLVGALVPVLWPEGARPAPNTVRLFVQGLNTPREDGEDPGGDTRLRRYLSEGYLPGPVVAVHNGTALEGTADVSGGVRAWRERLIDASVPLRRRDFVRGAAMRFLGVGVQPGQETDEILRLAALIEAALRDKSAPGLHLIGYSDGSLLIEHALGLAARRWTKARRQAGERDAVRGVEVDLRARVFLELWGNVSPPVARGPRRLFIHDRTDPVTGKVMLGRRVGVLEAADLPSHAAAGARIVTFTSPWGDVNVHNALCAIGPALREVLRRELGPAGAPPPGQPVPFDRTPTLLLWEALKDGPVQRDMGGLGLRWKAYAAHRWRT